MIFQQSSNELWERLHEAGEVEYDRLWRMPLDEDYGPQIYSSNADLQNVSLAIALAIEFLPIMRFQSRLVVVLRGVRLQRCSSRRLLKAVMARMDRVRL